VSREKRDDPSSDDTPRRRSGDPAAPAPTDGRRLAAGVAGAALLGVVVSSLAGAAFGVASAGTVRSGSPLVVAALDALGVVDNLGALFGALAGAVVAVSGAESGDATDAAVGSGTAVAAGGAVLSVLATLGPLSGFGRSLTAVAVAALGAAVAAGGVVYAVRAARDRR
jgi:hypothetical protein